MGIHFNPQLKYMNFMCSNYLTDHGFCFAVFALIPFGHLIGKSLNLSFKSLQNIFYARRPLSAKLLEGDLP